ncbi:MAG TPA: hypothetical protein VGJ87_14130 [Roseiflexaceae bacterium]|jgi:hypothetical protein
MLRVLSIALGVIAGIHGLIHMLGFVANWADERSPWLVYEIEAATFNTDVSTYIRQTGP